MIIITGNRAQKGKERSRRMSMRKWRFDDFEKKEMKQANASNSKNHSRIQTSGESERGTQILVDARNVIYPYYYQVFSNLIVRFAIVIGTQNSWRLISEIKKKNYFKAEETDQQNTRINRVVKS